MPIVEINQLECVSQCPICDSSDSLNLFFGYDWIYGLPGEFPIVCCQNCQLLYLRERPGADTIKRYYPEEEYYSYHSQMPYNLFSRGDMMAAGWYHLKKSILAERYNYKHLIKSRLPANLIRILSVGPLHYRATFELGVLLHPYVKAGSLLEIGCGSGEYLDLMRSLGWQRVIGVDISSQAINKARNELGLETYCGTLQDIGFEDDSIDAVSMSHTLEHVLEPLEVLREIYRILKPGGRLAIVVPNAESLAARMFGKFWYEMDPPRHIVNFTKRSLTLALERNNFLIEQLSTLSRRTYDVLLLSHQRKANSNNGGGNTPEFMNRFDPSSFSMARRTWAWGLSKIERIQVAMGKPVGEELAVVAFKPSI